MVITGNIESKDFFKAVLENSYDAIGVIDAKGVAQYISPSATLMHGYTSEEIVGKPSMIIVHPDDIPLAQKLFSKVLAQPGIPFKGDIRVVTKKRINKKLGISCNKPS